MAKFPYTPNPANVARFFEHIQAAGVPGKVDSKYLESVEFSSSYDRPLPGVLKFLGFLDASGLPTDAWRTYKDKSQAPRVMAQAIREAYSDLFRLFPDAYRKDEEALHNYFSAQTGLAKGTVGYMVRTFKALCDLADFQAPAPETLMKPTTAPAARPVPVLPAERHEPPGMTVNINIQLALPATEDASVYENLFAALKKHLLS